MLYRHNGRKLRRVAMTTLRGNKWFVSAVVPLAFRRVTVEGLTRTAVERTDDRPGVWTV